MSDQTTAPTVARDAFGEGLTAVTVATYTGSETLVFETPEDAQTRLDNALDAIDQSGGDA